MALVQSILVTGLQRIFDQESALFDGWPVTLEDAANRWADAFDSYASAVTPPSTTSAAAKSVFLSTFLTITFENGNVQFPLSFYNYAVALAVGMAPTFTGVPPIAPPSFDSVYPIGYGGGSSNECIQALVGVLDAWMKTGTAIPVAPGPTIPWV